MEKKNVVIKVDDEREYRALMKYYDTRGWKWINNVEASSRLYVFDEGDGNPRIYIDFKCAFTSCATSNDNEIIIPFAHLAAIEGIELDPEVTVQVGSMTATIQPFAVSFSEPTSYICKSAIEEIYTALKSFEK